MRFVSTAIRAFWGPRHTWTYKRDGIRQFRNLAARLDDAFAWASEEVQSCADAPVFLFSAGWRSGSTLLQRMIMQNNQKIVMWGEPYNLCNIFDGLADQFRAFTSNWPKEFHFLSKIERADLSDQWVANLYPDVDELIRAHRSFVSTLFAEPAKAFGGDNWGMKVVRLDIDHASYLRRIYPSAKIVFLCRNPFASYASFRKVYDGWFAKWPNEVVATPYAYGKNWAKLTRGFVEGVDSVGGFFIKYEDLDNEGRCQELGEYLGWPISKASSLLRIVGGVGGMAGESRPSLPIAERVLLQIAVKGVLELAGYSE